MQAFPLITPKVHGALRGLLALFFILAFGAALWRAPHPTPPIFVAPPAPNGNALPAVQQAEMLPGMGEVAGTPSLTRLADGRIACVWASGVEGNREQTIIWFATREKNGWSEPLPIANREYAAGAVFAHIRQINSPVIHQHGALLHLWYGAAGVGAQNSQSIIHSVSSNDGEHWTTPTRLQTSPFANSGAQLNAPPVALQDGGLALPISQRLFSQHGEWLRLDATGQVLDKARMALDGATLNPAVLAIDSHRAIALLQDGKAQQISAASTDNGGQSWQALAIPAIANPNTPIALTRLPSGRLLLATNSAAGRGTLALWIGNAKADQWQLVRSVESADDGAADFSEPTLLATPDGWIHLAYSWRQQGIRYMNFSEAWLDRDNQ